MEPQKTQKSQNLEIKFLADTIRQTGFEIHCYFGNGFLEKVYENALVHRLKKIGLHIRQQEPIKIYDEDDFCVGDYIGDILVGINAQYDKKESILVELKACKELSNEHEAQILHYLKATGIKHGLLINFGAEKYQIKKFIL